MSVSGVLIRSSSDFTKLVKLKSSDLHTEIIIRRTPFGQVFHLKPEVDGQSLGVVPHANTPELKEVIPGSQAAQVTLDRTNTEYTEYTECTDFQNIQNVTIRRG